MAYLGTARRAPARTTQTVNPQGVLPDVSAQIHSLSPETMPLISILEKIGSGPAPRNKKVQQRRHYEFDHLDLATATLAGVIGDGETRFARLTMEQSSRPQMRGSMYYQPQDKLLIVETGQVVEVWITPDAAYKINGSEVTLSTTITGNTTTRSLAGTIVVRVVEQVNWIPVTGTTQTYFLGRTIWESQPVEAMPTQEDLIYDYNYVEHFEDVLICTEDQMNFIEMHGKLNDWSFQQKNTVTRMKKNLSYRSFWGERAVNYDQPNRPTFHMRGIMNAIRTNVTVYDPGTTASFENLMGEFIFKQAFKFNNGTKRKLAFAGGQFMHNFNNAFKDQRRSDINVAKQMPGLDIQTYTWMGFTLDLVRNEIFRLDTPHSDWCVVIDPSQAELRVKKNFESWKFGGRAVGEREDKLAFEWQGTIAYHLEEHHALLRTA